jgi:hypothetical protein
MKRGNRTAVCVATTVAVLLWVAPALAYLGPGAGLTAIGAFLALIVGMIVAFVGFIWYPVKRFLRKGKSQSVAASDVREKAQS